MNFLYRFATVEVMRQYGQLLTYFYSNPESVNDCIFTMMHHVSGDLNAPENLFIPQVLETFSDIWERVRNFFSSSSSFMRRKNTSAKNILYLLLLSGGH